MPGRVRRFQFSDFQGEETAKLAAVQFSESVNKLVTQFDILKGKATKRKHVSL